MDDENRNARDCAHGSLRRTCEVCRLDERIASLEAALHERDTQCHTFAAKVIELESALAAKTVECERLKARVRTYLTAPPQLRGEANRDLQAEMDPVAYGRSALAASRGEG